MAAAIVARDIPAGSYVNLGIGQPTTVADHLAPDSGVVLHTENGMLGMGAGGRRRRDRPRPDQRRQDPGHRAARGVVLPPRRLVRDDARRPPRRLRARRLPGRPRTGDLANWHTGAPDAIPAVGGAMDLAIGAKQRAA